LVTSNEQLEMFLKSILKLKVTFCTTPKPNSKLTKNFKQKIFLLKKTLLVRQKAKIKL